MTHPLDKVYRFATAPQWTTGRSEGFVLRSDGGQVELAMPGQLVATPVLGTSAQDAGSLLATDILGRLLWLRPDGGVWALAEDVAVRIARISPNLSRSAVRLIWGQNFAWLQTAGDLVRIDASNGARLGSFRDDRWHIRSIIGDKCDGVIAIEQHLEKKKLLRFRRVRADGQTVTLPSEIEAVENVLAARHIVDQSAQLVLSGEDAWTHAFANLEDGTNDLTTYSIPAASKIGSAIAASPTALFVVDESEKALFNVSGGHLGRAEIPIDAKGCEIGTISDLIWQDDGLVAATSTGLWRLERDYSNAPGQRAVWLSPVLHSPLGERRGWQRADVVADLPEGSELTVTALGFSSENEANDARDIYLGNTQNLINDPKWIDDGADITRHFGKGETTCQHYLGMFKDEQFLFLRITLTVASCVGPASLKTLRVLYPRRSLIEHLPAIYSDGGRSERQMRRVLAGFQSIVDDIDDKITNSSINIDPEKADGVWPSFLLHWLGHTELAQLPDPKRKLFLRALPTLMRQRGTLAALSGVMDILAPDQYEIRNDGSGPDDWLLLDRNDPVGARLGSQTRLGHTDPLPITLGACAPLGQHPLGEVCGGAASETCSSDVVVAIFGDDALQAELTPFLDAVARLIAPAHSGLRFIFTQHRPVQGLGFGPGLDQIQLDSGASLALGHWSLPDAGTHVSPETPAVLDHATLNGNLVLE